MSYNLYHKRVDAQELGPSAPTDLSVWLFFQIAADHILLPILVTTVLFSPTVSRHPTVVSVCCTWIIAGIVSCLLFYVGHHVGPEPPKGLCVAQSALITPIPPMASVAALALVYYTWSTFRPSTLKGGCRLQPSRLVTVCLVAAPYITYVIFAAVGLQFGLKHPDRVNRSRRYFYCSMDWNAYNDVMALFTAAVCLVATTFEAHLVIMLSRNWTALRRAGMNVGIDLQLITRVGLFTAYIVCGTATMFVTVADTSVSVVPDMFAASTGLAFFLVFSTQPDIIRAWSNVLLRRSYTGSRLQTRAQTPDMTRAPTPLPSYDCSLLERTNSEVNEKARLAALHAYYKSRVQDMGVEVEVIKRPEDAFFVGREPRRVWAVEGNVGTYWETIMPR